MTVESGADVPRSSNFSLNAAVLRESILYSVVIIAYSTQNQSRTKETKTDLCADGSEDKLNVFGRRDVILSSVMLDGVSGIEFEHAD